MNGQNGTHLQEELGHKFRSIVGNQVGWKTMWELPVGDGSSSNFLCRYSLQQDWTVRKNVVNCSVMKRRYRFPRGV